MNKSKDPKAKVWSWAKLDLNTPYCQEIQLLKQLSRTSYGFFFDLVMRFANTDGCLAYRDGETLISMNDQSFMAAMRRLGWVDLEIRTALDHLMSPEIHLLYKRKDELIAITGLTYDPDAPVLHIPERPDKAESDGRYYPIKVGDWNVQNALPNSEHALMTTEKIDTDLYVTMDEFAAMVGITGENAAATVRQYLRRKGLMEFTVKCWKHKVVYRWAVDELAKCYHGVISLDDFQTWYLSHETCLSHKTSHETSRDSHETVMRHHETSRDIDLKSDDKYSKNSLSHENCLMTQEIRDKNIDDDDIHKRTRDKVTDEYLKELYAVGFDTKPSSKDLTELKKYHRQMKFSLLLECLKATRAAGGQNFAYLHAVIANLPPDRVEGAPFDPERDTSDFVSLVICEYPHVSINTAQKIIQSLQRFYSNDDLKFALRECCIYQLEFTKENMKKKLHEIGKVRTEMT